MKPEQHITIMLPTRVDSALGQFAKKAGQRKSDYAQALFMAAYSARCADTGDAELQAAVAAIEPAQELAAARARIAELEAGRAAAAASTTDAADAALAEAQATIEARDREITRLGNISHRRRELEQENAALRQEVADLKRTVDRGHQSLQGLMGELDDARRLPPPIRTDDLVMAVVVASGAGLSPAAIAAGCGLHETTVERLLVAWRVELAQSQRRAAA